MGPFFEPDFKINDFYDYKLMLKLRKCLISLNEFNTEINITLTINLAFKALMADKIIPCRSIYHGGNQVNKLKAMS